MRRPRAKAKPVDPTPYEYILLALAGLSALTSALSISHLRPYIMGVAYSTARRTLKQLRRDMATFVSLVDRLNQLVEAAGQGQERLGVGRGRMALEAPSWAEAQGIWREMSRIVNNLFRQATELSEAFYREGAPIEGMIELLASQVDSILQADNYKEAISKMREVSETIFDYIDEAGRAFG